MIKITVEEIEILVTTKIEDNLKQIIPKIKQMGEKIKQEFEKINMKDLIGDIDFKEIEKQTKEASKKIKEVFDPNDTSGMKINGKKLDEYSIKIKGVTKELKNYKAEIGSLDKYKGIDTVTSSNTQKYKNTELDKMHADWGQDKVRLSEIQKYKQEQEQVKNSAKETANSYGRWSNVLKQYYAILDQIKLKMAKLKQNTEKINPALKSVKGKANELKGAFNKLPNITANVNAKIKQMSKSTKTGLKHVLRYAGALFSLRGIYGVLSNSASAWLSSQNSQAKQLSANIEYMKYAMGSAFAPVIQYVTNLVYGLMKAIQSVVYALFKVNIFANASAKSYSNMADSASKASKETKSLAGFDEINNIGGSDSGSSGESGTTAPNMDLSTLDTSLVDKLSNINFEELGKKLGEKLNNALDNIPWNSIKEKAKNIGTNIALFLNGFIKEADWNNVGNTVAQGLNTAIEFAHSFITTFDFKEFGKSIVETINGFFKNTDWNKLAKTWSEFSAGIYSAITGFISNIDWSSIINAIINFIKGLDYGKVWSSFSEMLGSAAGSLVNLGVVIGEKINQAIDNAKTYFSTKIKEAGGNIVAGIFDGIIEGLRNIGQWVIDHIFKPFINGFKNAFKINSPSKIMEDMGKYIIDGLKNGLKGIWEKVKSIFSNLKTNISNTFKDTVTKIKEKFSVSSIKSHFSKVVSGIKSVFSNIPNWFKDKFSSAWTKVKDVFSKGGKVFTGIKDGILSSLKGVINKLIDGINKVISKPFEGINKALDKIKGVNILGKKPFSGLPTISVPQIPKLATGNVATEETLALFGEYTNAKSNPEITAPQSIIYDTMKQALDDSALSSNKGNGSMPKQIVIKFGSTRVAYEIEELIRKAQRQNGTATVTI